MTAGKYAVKVKYSRKTSKHSCLRHMQAQNPARMSKTCLFTTFQAYIVLGFACDVKMNQSTPSSYEPFEAICKPRLLHKRFVDLPAFAFHFECL